MLTNGSMSHNVRPVLIFKVCEGLLLLLVVKEASIVHVVENDACVAKAVISLVGADGDGRDLRML